MSTITCATPPVATQLMEILDPTGELGEVRQVVCAPRPADLGGATIGLLDNGKPNVAAFFDRLEERIKSGLEGAKVLRFSKLGKASAADLVPEGILIPLTTRCRVVINGIGD